MLSVASLALSAGPSGTYSGGVSILGKSLNAKLSTVDATHASIDITGLATVSCPSESYSYAAGKVTLPNEGTAGDCAHDALAKNSASITAIDYDEAGDFITVHAKKDFIPVSLKLTKSAAIVEEKAVESDVSSYFAGFEKLYGKMYTEEERPFRLANFLETLATITKRNLDGELGTHWINEFADLSPEEFKARFLGYKPKMSLFGNDEMDIPLEKPTKSVDWRGSKFLTPVKDQGQCGSCWAFSATEQIESDVALATGTLLELSPQQITSCDKVDQGCNGGNTETAYAYVEKAGGLEAGKEYPYSSGKAGKSGKCKATKGSSKATIKGFKTVSKSARSEKKMIAQIKKSPISVCVDANTWQTYDSGIVGKSCGAELDHCVQAVGYHTGGHTDYWIIRNSWGASWGEEGYIYVKAGIDACGVAKDATITTGASLV